MNSFLYYTVAFFVGYCGLTSALFMLSFVVPKAAFFARCLAMYLAFFACAVYGTVSSIIFTLLGKQNIAQWSTARAFLYVGYIATGTSFYVEDPKDILGTTRPAVFLGNHQTELDVLMLGPLFPKYCSVTAKSSLKYIPFLGWFMSLSGSIFIDRSNSKDARHAMQGAADQMKSRQQSVYMFPEGTRSYAKEPTLLPFKKGAFHLAVQAGVPIVPCVVANYSHILYPKDYVFKAGSVPIKSMLPRKRDTVYKIRMLTKYSPRPHSHQRHDLCRRRRARPQHPRTDAQGAHCPHCQGARPAHGRTGQHDLGQILRRRHQELDRG